MKINFLEIAQIELDDAIEYYNYELPGLGDAFLTEILNALDRIGELPEAWHSCSKRTRRCQTKRFPYGVIYQIREKKYWLLPSLIFTENLIIGRKDYNFHSSSRLAFAIHKTSLNPIYVSRQVYTLKQEWSNQQGNTLFL